MILSILDLTFPLIKHSLGSFNLEICILKFWKIFWKLSPSHHFLCSLLKELLLLEITSLSPSFSSFLSFGDTLWVITQLYLPLLLLNLPVLYLISKIFVC